MNIDVCPRCGKMLYAWDRPHMCPPSWEVMTKGEYNDPRLRYSKYWQTMYAANWADAAEAYVVQYVACDGPALGETEVYVRRPGDDSDERLFIVTGEEEVVYRVDPWLPPIPEVLPNE